MRLGDHGACVTLWPQLEPVSGADMLSFLAGAGLRVPDSVGLVFDLDATRGLGSVHGRVCRRLRHASGPDTGSDTFGYSFEQVSDLTRLAVCECVEGARPFLFLVAQLARDLQVLRSTLPSDPATLAFVAYRSMALANAPASAVVGMPHFEPATGSFGPLARSRVRQALALMPPDPPELCRRLRTKPGAGGLALVFLTLAADTYDDSARPDPGPWLPLMAAGGLEARFEGADLFLAGLLPIGVAAELDRQQYDHQYIFEVVGPVPDLTRSVFTAAVETALTLWEPGARGEYDHAKDAWEAAIRL